MAAAVTVTDLRDGSSHTEYFGSVKARNVYVDWILSQNRPVHIHSF